MAKKDIKFLTQAKIGRDVKKYCRFKKSGIKYIDYKDPSTTCVASGKTRTPLGFDALRYWPL